MYILWEIASAILVIIPLSAIGQAFRQTRSPRLLYALAAFGVLEVRFAFGIAFHSILAIDHGLADSVGFLIDLVAITLFAAAFLYATGWPFGRIRADLA